MKYFVSEASEMQQGFTYKGYAVYLVIVNLYLICRRLKTLIEGEIFCFCNLLLTKRS